MAMPAAIASRGVWPARGWPRKLMLPASGASMPNSTFINVLLPEPFSPSSPRISPDRTSRSTLSLARSSPKQRTIPRISSSEFTRAPPSTRIRRSMIQGAALRVRGAMRRTGMAATTGPQLDKSRSLPAAQLSLAAAARVVARRHNLHGARAKLLGHVLHFLDHGGGHDRIERLALGIDQRSARHRRR